MGWTRSARTGTLSQVRTPVDFRKEKDSEDAEHVEVVVDKTKDTQYPLLRGNTKESDLPLIDAEEVRKRDGKGSARLWIVVDEVVFDCTEYVSEHPGGRSVIENFGGQDCSWQWWTFHSRKEMKTFGLALRVGRTEGVENKYKQPKKFGTLRTIGDEW